MKCQQYLEKLQMIGPDSTDTPEGSKYQQLLEKCAWIIKRRQSMPVNHFYSIFHLFCLSFISLRSMHDYETFEYVYIYLQK